MNSVSTPIRLSHALLAGAAIGLLTGFIESAILAATLHLVGRFIISSRHAFWLAPLVDGLLFMLIAAGLALLSRLLPRLISPRVFWGALMFIAIVAITMHVHQLHRAAGILIALGAAVQLSRMLGRHLEAADRMARTAAAGLGVTLVVMATGFLLGARLTERRALARLSAAEAGAPNVLFIILDTVRAANLSLYGYGRPTSPAIARFAARGAVFEHALAPSSWTLPSHSVMFTGRQPNHLTASWNTPLERGPRTLAAVLGERGYSTAGIVANARYCGWETGLARGFAHYEDYPLTVGEALRSTSLTDGFHDTFARRLDLPALLPRKTAADINRRLFRWIGDRDSTRPWFVFLNYLDAHDVYDPPEPFRSRFADSAPVAALDENQRLTQAQVKPRMDLYDGAIAYLDDQVGVMLDSLERRGLLENTIVIITADHGEEFAEHGMNDHGVSLYRPALEVPLIVVYPPKVPAGVRVPAPVGTRDLPATIAELAGADPVFEGVSLTSYWSAPAAASSPILSHIRRLIRRPAWFPASRGDMYALAMDGYHYIRNEGDGSEELYDLVRDPLELRDLVRSPDGIRMLPELRLALQLIRNGEATASH